MIPINHQNNTISKCNRISDPSKIGIILIIEINHGHIEIMLIIEIAKLELIGGHIGFMLIIEIAKIE